MLDSGLSLCGFFFCFQLRSAGAAVIQELFPRVSSIATLDISDNGMLALFFIFFMALRQRFLTSLSLD